MLATQHYKFFKIKFNFYHHINNTQNTLRII